MKKTLFLLLALLLLLLPGCKHRQPAPTDIQVLRQGSLAPADDDTTPVVYVSVRDQSRHVFGLRAEVERLLRAEKYDITDNPSQAGFIIQASVLEAGITGPEGHPLSRPAEAEADAVSRLLYLAQIAGARVNVVHLSTELGLLAVRAARARGQQGIYVETCPQYLTLDDTRYLEAGDDGFAGAKYVMSPPLRKPRDVRALREAVLAGEVDSIATDHCSFNLHGQKDRGRGDFTKIPNGGPGIEHRPAVMATTFESQLGPEGLCRLLAEGPARTFGLWPERGRLAVGAAADVCVWDPSARWTISAATQHQAVDYTPWEGFEARGRAHLVYVGGELVARDGEPCGPTPGRYVAR